MNAIWRSTNGIIALASTIEKGNHLHMRSLPLFPLLLLSTQALAQDAGEPEQPDEPENGGAIIVTAPDKPKKSVQSGSRIEREPLFTDLTYRSNTGLSGATSGNGGFEPFNLSNPMAKTKVRECKADRDGLGKAAICLMGSAKKALETGDIDGGHEMLRHVASAGEFSPDDKLAASELLYASARDSGNAPLREEALVRMIASGAMAPDEAQQGRRALVSMALKDKRTELAIERLERVIHHDPQDARSLANLAILSRAAGRAEAGSIMQRAISAFERGGKTAPKAWRDFAREL